MTKSPIMHREQLDRVLPKFLCNGYYPVRRFRFKRLSGHDGINMPVSGEGGMCPTDITFSLTEKLATKEWVSRKHQCVQSVCGYKVKRTAAWKEIWQLSRILPRVVARDSLDTCFLYQKRWLSHLNKAKCPKKRLSQKQTCCWRMHCLGCVVIKIYVRGGCCFI